MKNPAILLSFVAICAFLSGCENESNDDASSQSSQDHVMTDDPATDPKVPSESPSKVCGDGKVTDDEACDTKAAMTKTCADFEPRLTWADGGVPQCNATCTGLTIGSCIPKSDKPDTPDPGQHDPVDDPDTKPVCGDGKVTGDEICDTNAAMTKSCSDLDNSVEWADGGLPVCDQCTALDPGTCREIKTHEIQFMNWNVQFDYVAGGGKPVPPRAEKLYNTMKTWKKLPEIFALVEASPNWHAPDVVAKFDDLGYAWADADIDETWHDWGEGGFTCGENKQNAFLETTTQDEAASCFLFTTVLYQKDRFELLETQYVKLFPPTDWDGLPENCSLHIRGDFCSTYDPDNLYCNNKTISFAAVLHDKVTDENFIAVSNHWNPNNGVTSSAPPASYIGPVAENERVRVYGANKAAELVKSLQAKYPGAHTFFGGDLNTVDIDQLSQATIFKTFSITDAASMIRALNKWMVLDPNSGIDYTVDRLPENFVGSHSTFGRESGLLDARTVAKATFPDFKDHNTTSDPQVLAITDIIGVTVVIDYAFYSPELTLTNYYIPSDDVYVEISDHSPLITTYSFKK